MVRPVEVPKHSEIGKHLAGAQAFDAFAVPLDGRRRSALEIYIEVMASSPEWINCLMAVRNRAVGLFGLKPLGRLNDIDTARKPETYRVGNRVGIFSIVYLAEREVILVESDRHLEAKVSLCLSGEGQDSSAVLSTVIHVRNLLGHAYLLAVWPAHKLMFPAMLARFARSRRNA
ncbi:MAG: DUF2867 domain-containing protein [Sterolibacterium sp.]